MSSTHPIPVGTPVFVIDDDGSRLAGSTVESARQISTGAWVYEVSGEWAGRWFAGDVEPDTPAHREAMRARGFGSLIDRADISQAERQQQRAELWAAKTEDEG